MNNAIRIERKSKVKTIITKPTTYDKIGTALPLAVGVIGLCLWISKIAQNITAPGMEYSEGFVRYLNHLFASGQWNYASITQGPPYQTSFYTPIFYWIAGLFGDSLFVGRLVDVICALLSMALVYLIVHKLSKSKILSLFAALVPTTQYIFLQWSLILKTDLMALMFELAGIFMVIRYPKSKLMLLSIPFFVLAFFTKQSFVAGALATALYLVLESKNEGNFAFFVTGMLVAVVLPLAIAGYATNGEFLRQIVTYQQTVPTFLTTGNYFKWVMASFWTLLPFTIPGIFFAFKNPKHLLTIYAALSIIIALASMSRSGMSQIYMLESIFAVAMVAAIGLREVIRARQTIYLTLIVVVPLVALFSSSLMYSVTDEYKADVKAATALISDADYPILTENADMVLDAGKIPYLCDPFVFMNLSKLGKWDQQPILNDLNNKKIPYVITQCTIESKLVIRMTDEVYAAIKANYHVVMDKSAYPYGFVIYKANGGE